MAGWGRYCLGGLWILEYIPYSDVIIYRHIIRTCNYGGYIHSLKDVNPSARQIWCAVPRWKLQHCGGETASRLHKHASKSPMVSFALTRPVAGRRHSNGVSPRGISNRPERKLHAASSRGLKPTLFLFPEPSRFQRKKTLLCKWPILKYALNQCKGISGTAALLCS